MNKRIGITLGDQAGVGPEVVEAALQELGEIDGVQFMIIGDKVNVTPGKPNIETAQAALDSLEKAASMINSGELDAIVTAPVAKEWLHRVGFNFPGQTEFFAERLHCESHAMCLTGKHLTVALVSIHIALEEAVSILSQCEIIRIGGLLEEYCRNKHKRAPRIAVCGLNPHASENGAFGNEEEHTIIPAITELNARYTEEDIFTGPHPPDTIFRPAADGEYDAVLCMYHDQGLIPLKLLDFDTGVNTTLGLKKPRTSPDHGTAYDIAGKGIAKHSSMRHAIELAIQLSQSP